MTKFLSIFDPESKTPKLAADLAKLDELEALKVADYLESGAVLMRTTKLVADAVDGTPEAVAISTRTDGEWVWSEAIAYYVRRYHVAPPAEFLAHLTEVNYVMPKVDGARRTELVEGLAVRPFPTRS